MGGGAFPRGETAILPLPRHRVRRVDQASHDPERAVVAASAHRSMGSIACHHPSTSASAIATMACPRSASPSERRNSDRSGIISPSPQESLASARTSAPCAATGTRGTSSLAASNSARRDTEERNLLSTTPEPPENATRKNFLGERGAIPKTIDTCQLDEAFQLW